MEYSLGEAIKLFLERNGIREETEARMIMDKWESIMGSAIAANTQELSYKKGTLLIKISSPVWRQELQFARLQIRDTLNKQVGRTIFTDVRVI